MDSDLIQRYQPGGDIYISLTGTLGVAGANSVAAAALTGDESQVNAAISQAEFGNPLTTSTASIFGQEILTDPLAAPLDDLEGVIKASVGDVFDNPLVLISVIAIIGGVVVYVVGVNNVRKLWE